MPKRQTDTEIWREGWFQDMTPHNKLLWFYIKDTCDIAGIWRVNKRDFQQKNPGIIVYLDDFLDQVNKTGDDDGLTVERIIEIDKKTWFIPKFWSFHHGMKFTPKNPVHVSALKLLIKNNIPLSKVVDFDFGKLQYIDYKTIASMLLDRSLMAAWKEPGSPSVVSGQEAFTPNDHNNVYVHNNDNSGVLEKSEKPFDFPLQKIYDLSWSEVDTRSNIFRGVTEELFAEWKQLVDFVIEHRMHELFRAKFLNPADFVELRNVKGFTRESWDSVLRKILSTGVQPTHNLYFRIPDYLTYVQPKDRKKSSVMAAGETDWAKEKSWG